MYMLICVQLDWFSSFSTHTHTHTHILIYKALCFDMAQGRMNGAPIETRTHSCRFASLAC